MSARALDLRLVGKRVLTPVNRIGLYAILIKTAMRNRALAWDFRPPASGKLPDLPEKLKKWEGLEYRLMVEAQAAPPPLDTITPHPNSRSHGLRRLHGFFSRNQCYQLIRAIGEIRGFEWL